jgi:DNA-binding GntR family transcriptional regulator
MSKAAPLQKKLPRKNKHWEKEILEALTAATLLKRERYFGTFVSEDDPSELAKDRDAFTALGVMHAFMFRNITNKTEMLEKRLAVYRHIFDELRDNTINHPGEMFVSAYLYSHVVLNLISEKKYCEIIELFSHEYAEQLRWNSDDYMNDYVNESQ